MANLLLLSDGSVLKVNGKEVFEAIYSGVIKQVDVPNRKMQMVGTDETVDREGDIVATNGGKLENYRKNPVFLWAHNYSSVPLARAEKIVKKRDPVRMEFHLIYPTKGLHPFADMILELYGESIINASSIGFIPNKWEPLGEEDEKREPNTLHYWNPRKYLDWELLELSGCPVPCNPNALQNALASKSFLNMPFAEVQKWLQGKSVPPKPDKTDDIMGELQLKVADFVDEVKPVMVQVPKTLCAVEEEKEECMNWAKDETGQDVQFEEKDFITKEEALKPYPNEHACRLANPDDFDKFARKNCYIKHDDKCIDCIFGIKDAKSKMQAMRYPKASWTVSAAKSHCKSHEGSFEAAKEMELEEEKDSFFAIKEVLEGLSKQFLEFMKEIKDQNIQVLEAVKSLKPAVADPALPIDQSHNGGEEEKTASGTILEQAFEQSKGKPGLPPSPLPPQLQYDQLKGVTEATKDLKNVISRFKTILERR